MIPDAEQGWSAWPAPAKLNLFLRVLGRRPDGYHSLQTVFRLLDWGDVVHLRPRGDGQILRHGESDIPPHLDLAVGAAKLLQGATNARQGADIVVEKRIPLGGGFGGGSSNAATVLLGLDLLWGTGLALLDLRTLGAQLGADVPVFIGGRNAWAEGVGETLTPVDLPPAWYVLADPGVHADTAQLFAAPELTRDAAPTTMLQFLSGAVRDNAFEPVLRRREPAVEATFAAMQAIGEPRLTGSGSGVFVEFGDRAAAEAALRQLKPSLRAWIAEGADVSPLHRAMREYASRPGN